MATELATAYVALVPSLRGATRQIQSELSGVDLKGVGRTMGKSLAGGVSSTLKESTSSMFGGMASAAAKASKGVVAALGGIGGAIGSIAATGGMSRALNLEKAQTMFKGLKLDWNDFASTIQASVDGTAFTMDAAALTAAQLAAAGVKAGNDMERALNGAVGVSATFGADLADLGGIYAKVAAQGKLTGDTIQQMSDRGINARAVLADALGKSSDEISEMVTKGKIDFKTFSDAMYEAFGDSAAGANETFSGSLANMKSALNKIGQNFAEPFMKAAIPVFNATREALNALRGAIDPLVPAFTAGMEAVSSAVVSKMGALKDALSPEKVQAALDAASSAFDGFRARAQAALDFLKASPVFEPIAVALEKLASLVSENGGKIAAAAGAVMGLGAAFGALSTVFSVIPGIGGLLGALSGGGATLGIFSGGLSLVSGALALLQGPLGIVAASVAALGAAVAYTAQTNPVFAAQLSQMAQIIGGQLSSLATTLLMSLQSLATALLPMIMTAMQMIAPVIAQIVAAVMQLVSGLLPVLNAALTALMPVVQSIATTAMAVVQQVLAAVLPVISSLVSMIQAHMPQILSIITMMTTGIVSVIQTAWPVVQSVVQNVVSIVSGIIETYWPRIQAVIEQVMSVVLSVIQTVWPQVQTLVETAVSAIGSFIDQYWPQIEATISSAMEVVMSVIETVWPLIQTIIETAMDVIGNVISVVTAAISGDWDGVWNGMSDLLQSIWDGMCDIVSSAIDTVVNFVSEIPDKIAGFFSNAGDLLLSAGESIISGLLNGITSAIGGVYDFVSGIGSTIASLKGPEEYDRKLLIPNGGWIMEGLGTGLKRGFERDVVPLVAGMGGEIADGMWTHGFHASASLADGVADGAGKLDAAMSSMVDAYRSRANDFKEASSEIADAVWGGISGAVASLGRTKAGTQGVYAAFDAIRKAGYDLDSYTQAVATYNKESGEWTAKLAASRKEIKEGYAEWRAEEDYKAKIAALDEKIAKAEAKESKSKKSSGSKALANLKAQKEALQDKCEAQKEANRYAKEAAEWQDKLKNGDASLNEQYAAWIEDNAELKRLMATVQKNATMDDLAEWWNVAEMKAAVNDAIDYADGYSKTLDKLFQKSNTFSDAGAVFTKGFVEKFVTGSEDYRDALDKLGNMTSEQIQHMVDCYEDSARAERELEMNQRSLWVNGLKATTSGAKNVKDLMLDFRETCLDVKEAVYGDAGLTAAFEKAGVSFEGFAMDLQSVGYTMDDFKSKYDSMVQTVSNGFQKMSRENQIGASEWQSNLRANMAESQAFADNLAKVMAKIPESIDSDAFRKAVLEGGYSQFGQMMADMASMSAQQIGELIGLYNESIIEGQQSAIEQFQAIAPGEEMMLAAIEGINSLNEELATAAGDAALGAANKMASYSMEFNSIGALLIDGASAGVMARASTLAAAAAAAVRSAIAAAKAEAGIHSPSRVMDREIGQMMGAGAAMGIGKSTRKVVAAMDGLMDSAIESAYGKGLGFDLAPNLSATSVSERKIVSYQGGDIYLTADIRDGYDARRLAREIAREQQAEAKALGID